jgi:hypothetical protein
MMSSSPGEAAYHELAYYTLAHPDPAFIHQHVVDAFAAQNADPDTKPIKLAFALVGLFLHIERGYTGREVQRAHMKLARHKRAWPGFRLPGARGAITTAEVLRAPPGPERDQAIEDWMRSVWDAYRNCHDEVAELVRMEGA